MQMGMTEAEFRLHRNSREPLYSQIMQPIISAGDAVGSVLLLGKNERDVMGESEKMLIKTGNRFSWKADGAIIIYNKLRESSETNSGN